ncbi:MAG: ParA family protein [Phycisphaerae bacterium]|nr:ParA family protein [Phycisphaerae bacterium]
MSEHGSPARVLAFINQKGGVGKTTSCVNVAAALALRGRRTLLIDLDSQAHATLHLGAEPGGPSSIYPTLVEGQPLAPTPVAPNLDLVSAETDLAAAEADLASADDRQHRLARALDAVRHRYDAILIDCPPSLGLLTISALTAAQQVVIPMQAHFLALQGVGKLLETISLVASTLNPSLRVLGVVVCAHDASAAHTGEVVADLERFFDAARAEASPWSAAVVFRPFVRRNIKLAEAPSFGKTIFDYAPLAPGAADYRAVADAIAAVSDALPRVVVAPRAAELVR